MQITKLSAKIIIYLKLMTKLLLYLINMFLLLFVVWTLEQDVFNYMVIIKGTKNTTPKIL